ncbi:MAG: membrane associated rhomboid family serine protease [Planctomycetota bacterium]|jgi:membrane associated rhomboid family serine protease
MNPIEGVFNKYSPHRVTSILVLLSSLVFVVQMVLGTGIIGRFGLIPALAGFNTNAYTFITAMFLHGGFFHILFNMWYLDMFGKEIEGGMKSWQYLLLYLSGGIVAGIIHILFNLGSMVPVIGASGAISALMGYYAYFYHDRRIVSYIFGIFRSTMTIRSFMLFWFGIQLLGVIGGALGGFAGGIAWWAHIGGFAWGLLVAWLVAQIGKKRKKEEVLYPEIEESIWRR